VRLIPPFIAAQAVIACRLLIPLGLSPGVFLQGSSPVGRQEKAHGSLRPETERRLRQAVQANPQSFEANHTLGEFYVNAGKLAEGIPYLEVAQRLDPTHYVNGYDLALAYLETNKLVQARQQVHSLLQRQNLAELHNLLGEIEEQQGD
jgi:predicted Zn-dependent protease